MGNRKEDEKRLQEYLTEKRLDSLFIEIVEELLLDAPDNPVKYMIDYLVQHFPNQARESSYLKTLSARNEISENTRDRKLVPEIRSQGLASGFLIDSRDEAEDNSSDNESDEEEETAVFRPSSKERARRFSVCGDHLNPMSLRDQYDTSVVRYKKDDAVLQQVMRTLEKKFPFSCIEENDLNTMVQTLRSETYEQDQTVIKQGDEGSYFYIIEKGSCDVITTNSSGVATRVLTVREADSFGELALLHNTVHPATVVVTSKFAQLWLVDRLTFKLILMDSSLKRRSFGVDALLKVPMLQSLTEVERLTLSDALVSVVYNPGDVILRQNSPGEKLYIIKSGSVRVVQKVSNDATPIELATLGEGRHFGATALLTNRPRAVSIIAGQDSQTVCLELERSTLNRIVGPLSVVMKRNMDKYRDLIADKI